MSVRPAQLRIEDFADAPEELQPYLERIFTALNPFLTDVSSTLDGGVEIGSGLRGEFKTVTVTVPSTLWIPWNAAAGAAPALKNSWVHYSAPYAVPAYKIDADGKVTTKGLLKNGTITAGTVLTTFPAAYAPSESLILKSSMAGSAHCEIRMNNNGDLALGDTGGNATWTSVDMLSWYASSPPTPQAFTGPGWPIVLRTKLPSVKICLCVRAEDQASGAVVTSSPGTPGWYLKDSQTAVVTRLSDLTPGRTYKLTFFLA